MTEKGKFIVFEGIDGAGKSTQVALLCQALKDMGREVFLTAEPTDLESGRAIRRVLSGSEKKSESEIAAMFVLDRIAHNADEQNGIEAILSGGKDIICDRYYYSNLAYHGYSTDYAWVRDMNILCPSIRRPDLCIYLDLTPEQSLGRIRARAETVEIYENEEKLTRVREAFLAVIDERRADGEKIFAIDASDTPSRVAEKVLEAVKKNLF